MKPESPEIRTSKTYTRLILHRQKIAFVDYQSEDFGRKALEAVKGFRFSNSTRGISKYHRLYLI